MTEQQSKLSYQELLDYARRISKFTLPSNFREDVSAAREVGQGDITSFTESLEKMDIDNPSTKDSAAQTPADPPAGAAATTAVAAGQHLPPHLSTWLDPHREYSFVPWPNEQTLRRGALAMIQPLVQEGRSLEGWEAEREVGRREVEMRAEEGWRKGVEEERGREEVVRRGSFGDGVVGGIVGDGGGGGGMPAQGVGGGGRRQGGDRERERERERERRQFSLDDLEDEDEDDDD